MNNTTMSSPINLKRFNALVNQYLSTRITTEKLSSLTPLSDQLFTILISDLDASTGLYNSFPDCINKPIYSADIFINTTHLKSIYDNPLPTYSSVLEYLQNNSQELDTVFAEMRDSTYFHHIYEIDKPDYLLANLMTLVYRCHLLATIPTLRENKAQISSTLEEMSALRYLQGDDNLYFQAVRHWIIDWDEEGYSQELAENVVRYPA